MGPRWSRTSTARASSITRLWGGSFRLGQALSLPPQRAVAVPNVNRSGKLYHYVVPPGFASSSILSRTSTARASSITAAAAYEVLGDPESRTSTARAGSITALAVATAVSRTSTARASSISTSPWRVSQPASQVPNVNRSGKLYHGAGLPPLASATRPERQPLGQALPQSEGGAERATRGKVPNVNRAGKLYHKFPGRSALSPCSCPERQPRGQALPHSRRIWPLRGSDLVLVMVGKSQTSTARASSTTSGDAGSVCARCRPERQPLGQALPRDPAVVAVTLSRTSTARASSTTHGHRRLPRRAHAVPNVNRSGKLYHKPGV